METTTSNKIKEIQLKAQQEINALLFIEQEAQNSKVLAQIEEIEKETQDAFIELKNTYGLGKALKIKNLFSKWSKLTNINVKVDGEYFGNINFTGHLFYTQAEAEFVEHLAKFTMLQDKHAIVELMGLINIIAKSKI